MMFQRVKVFVSSTVLDLVNERTAAERAIRKIDGDPLMSEKTFTAGDQTTIDKCIAQVKEADVYILILGERFGYPLYDGRSITELEWDTACELNKPRIVFNLEYFNKDENQKRFASKVGNVYLGRFWKQVANAFELSDEIEKSLRLLLDEERIKRQKLTEPVTLNLVEIEFPDNLFHGELNFNREEVIKKSVDAGFPMRKSADTRQIVFAAMRQNGHKFSGDWTHAGGRLFTFHDIGSKASPLNSIIDPGTIERESAKDFASISEDCKNIFKGLLKYCFKEKVFHAGIEWVYEDKLFRFQPTDSSLLTRIESWQGQKHSSRKVFEKIPNTYKGKDYSYCKHLAFRVSFVDIDSKWYMSILPDWSFTWDGKRKYFNEADKVKWLKEQERNQQVFNHFRFISNFIKEWDNNLYSERYPFIHFKDNVHLDAYPLLKDDDWLKKEKPNAIKHLKLDPDQISLELKR